MPSATPPDIPEIRWTWSSRGYGWLSTTIRPDGTIIQGRQYSPSSDPINEKIGKLSADDAGRIYDLAAAALAAANPSALDSATDSAPDAAPEDQAPHEEAFDLNLTDAAGVRATRVASSDLGSHPAMRQLRQAIIRVRHRAGGGYLSWRNVGARLAIVFILLLGWYAYLTLSGARNSSRMQREAQRIDATVTERHGKSGFDKHAYLIVRLTPIGSATAVDAQIADSLSAANWSASKPGATVRVWYHPATGQTYLEDDILRNIRDQTGIGLFPILFSLLMLPIIWFLSRYRAGTYPDGREFLIHGDRVSLDGKALPFSDSQLLAVRALIRLAS